jgi:NADH-quinone oxidoreductase subunit E
MSVRRLDPVQPESFAFTVENLAWAKKLIDKYPQGKQASAVIPLLWRAQEQNDGWVSRKAMETVADMLGMSYIRVLEVATFYTMFQLSPVGTRAHIQVCGTTPCMLRGAGDLIKVCQNKIHHEPHHLNEDGSMSWEEVECLGACVNAPMVQVWKDTYEDLTPEKLEKIIDDLAAGKKPKPGPQIDRQFSAPVGGPTTLTDPSLYSANRTFSRLEPPPPTVAAAPAPAAPPTPPPAAAPKAPEAKPVLAAPIEKPTLAAPAEKPALAAPAEKPALAAPKPAAPVPQSVKTPEGIIAGAEPVGRPAAAAAPKPERPDGQPELLKKPRAGAKADDLELIWGVGPGLAKTLNKMGIWHFDQIAAWTPKELKWVDANLKGFKGRASRDEWVKQAKKLATGWRPDSGVGERPAKKK